MNEEKKPMTEAEKFTDLNKIKPFSFDAKIKPDFMEKAIELFPDRKEAIEQVYGEFAIAMEGAMQAMYASFALKMRNALGNNKVVFLPEHRPVPSMRNVSKIIVPGNGRKR